MKVNDPVISKISVSKIGLKKGMRGKIFSCHRDGITYQVMFDKIKDHGSVCMQNMDLTMVKLSDKVKA